VLAGALCAAMLTAPERTFAWMAAPAWLPESDTVRQAGHCLEETNLLSDHPPATGGHNGLLRPSVVTECDGTLSSARLFRLIWAALDRRLAAVVAVRN